MKRFNFVLCLVGTLAISSAAHADTFGSGDNTFDIEFVTIGDPGNAADTTGAPNPAGSVPYSYRMGKFEISEQMIDKANDEGLLGITKDNRGADKPATSVSWNEAARFVNWLNTSSGSTPAYKFALQPGEVGYVANANIEVWTIGDSGYDPNNLYRNSLARYFLPSVDEWYKAAYYDPTSGVYYDYPTGSDSIPTPVANGTAAGTAVYNLQPGPADITLAGGLSPYGTMGQGGNVWEWEETELDLVNDSSSSRRGIRGGSWQLNSNGLLASIRANVNPTDQGFTFGFRVASIPEPSTLLLLGLGSLAALRRRPGSRSSLAQQGPKACLLEVMVGGQRIGDAALLHQQKRNAIRQGPVLVGALFVAVERLVKLRSSGWNHFDVRFRLKSANKTRGTDSRIQGRQRVGNFDQHPGRGHQSADASPTPFDGGRMVLVAGIHQGQQVVRVDKLNNHSPGFPCA